MIGRKTQALAWCAALLLLAELALRALDGAGDELAPLETRAPLALALGTSRTMRAIDPSVVEGVLREEGCGEVFAANVSLKAVTNVGLLRHWLEQVAPRLPSGARGVVAIEVRCEGFNDNYLLDDERTWLQATMSGLAPNEAPSSAPLSTPLHGRFSADDFSRELMSHLRLFAPADIVAAWWEAGDGDGELDWATVRPGAPRGFRPFQDEVRLKDLNRAYWEDHYRSRLLKDFVFGGLQSDSVERLIEAVRRAGLQPVLYLMPITDVQRSFFEPGQYAAVLANITALAARQKAPFIDLDSARAWPVRLFQDTNHMAPEASAAVSKLFAKKALAPQLSTLPASR